MSLLISIGLGVRDFHVGWRNGVGRNYRENSPEFYKSQATSCIRDKILTLSCQYLHF